MSARWRSQSVLILFEPFFELPAVYGHLFPCLPADDEGYEQLTDSVPVEVQFVPDPRPRMIVEGFDGVLHGFSDGAAGTVGRPAFRRVDLRYLRGRLFRHDTADPARRRVPRTFGGRAVSLYAAVRGVPLPLGEPRGVGDVREDLLRRTRDLDVRYDRCHGCSSLRLLCGRILRYGLGSGYGHGAYHAFGKAGCAYAEREVEAPSQVFERDRAGQLHELGFVEVLPQRGEEVVGYIHGRAAHACCVVEHELFQIREQGALAVVGQRQQLLVGQA